MIVYSSHLKIHLSQIHLVKYYIAGPIRFLSKNFPNHFITLDHEGNAWLRNHGARRFKLVRGLAGYSSYTVSIKSVDYECFYLRHMGYVITTDHPAVRTRNRAIFPQDATFRVHKHRWFYGFYSFESLNFPGFYLRHAGYRLRIARETSDSLFQNDASFKIY